MSFKDARLSIPFTCFGKLPVMKNLLNIKVMSTQLTLEMSTYADRGTIVLFYSNFFI